MHQITLAEVKAQASANGFHSIVDVIQAADVARASTHGALVADRLGILRDACFAAAPAAVLWPRAVRLDPAPPAVRRKRWAHVLAGEYLHQAATVIRREAR